MYAVVSITASLILLQCMTILGQEEDYLLTLQPFLGDKFLDPICPPSEDIYPCFCYIVDNHLMNLDCSDILDENELANIFSSTFPEPTFNILHMSGNGNIQVLQEDIFDKSSFVEIILRDGNVQKVESLSLKSSFKTATKLDFVANKIVRFPFEDLPNFSYLTDLYLGNNNIEGFPLLQSATLQVLSLAYNPIGILPSTAFENLPALVSIDLDHTHISILHPGTFSYLPSLAYLFLGRNYLFQLQNEDLSFRSVNMTVLSLSGNHIRTISPMAISGIGSRGSIYLDSNGIQRLHQEMWMPILELRTQLWLTDNPINCNCHLQWIIQNEAFRKQLQMTSCKDGTNFEDFTPQDFIAC